MKIRNVLHSLAVSFAVLAPSSAAWAQFSTEGVVYAFTEIRLGATKQYALLPMGAEPLRPDLPLQASLPTAFGVLRYGKPATYGNTSIQITDSDLARGQVKVNIDPAVVSNFEIIKAETVYTFTQLGVTTVIFPGLDDDGVTRADITYAAFRMQVPLWQAVLGGSVHESDILFPDGTSMDSDDFYTRLAAKDPAVSGQILSYLGSADVIPAFGILSVAATLQLPGTEQAVIPVLSSPTASLRSAAVPALAATTDPLALDALVGVMKTDADPAIRQRAASVLGQSSVESYRFYEVIFRMREGTAETRIAAIRQAGTITDPRVAEELGGLFVDADPTIRRAAVDAIFALAAFQKLKEALTNEALPEDTRLAAATGLADGASGAEKAEGLRYRGFAMTGELALDAVARLHAMQDFDARTFVESFLLHPDAGVAVFAARKLGERGSAESLDELGDVYETADVDLAQAIDEAAFEIMVKLPFSEIESYSTYRNVFLKRAAYRAFGVMAQSGQGGSSVRDLLVGGLTSPTPAIRGASARALASYRSAEALTQIMTVADDSDPTVRADVATALASFPGEANAEIVNPKVVEYVQSGDAIVVAAALTTLGELSQFQLLNVVLTNVQASDARVRAAAMRSAALLADPTQPRPVINSISAGLQDAEISNRVLACELLGGFNNDLAVVALTPMVNDNNLDVRIASISALGSTQNSGAAGALMALIEDPDREIRFVALAALRTLGMPAVTQDLNQYLSREQDPATAERLRETIEHLQNL